MKRLILDVALVGAAILAVVLVFKLAALADQEGAPCKFYCSPGVCCKAKE